MQPIASRHILIPRGEKLLAYNVDVRSDDLISQRSIWTEPPFHLMGRGYWVWLIPLGSGTTNFGIVVDANLHPYTRLNRFEKAIEWLETAFDERNGEMVFLHGEIAGAAEGDSLHRLGSDPRVQDLLRRMSLPQ